MASRPIPKSKPFAPPPDEGITANRLEPRRAKQSFQGNPKPPATMPEVELVPLPTPEPVIEQPRRRGLFALLVVLLLILLIGGGTLLGVVLVTRKPGRIDKEADRSLAHLKELQRAWFENEGLNKDASKDPAAAFSRLMAVQRQWWDNESLVKNGNMEGTEPLARLEDAQRSWWGKEGLAGGQKSKDPDAALDRLADLNRDWWKGNSIARSPDAISEEDIASGAAPAGSDRDYKLLTERQSTQKFLEIGGSEDSERAVQAGLKWLAAQQLPDGRWTANGNEGGRPRGRGGNDVASTALALLPFIAHGESHRGVEGKNAYSKKVEYGLKFLLSQQKPDGDLRGGGNMYVHALATMALCQALDTSADPLLKEPAQRAVTFLVKAQDPRGGGWRYTPGSPGDMSVSSWCLMALKSGQMAGLHVPSETLDKAGVFLEKVSRPDGGYNYMGGSPGHSPPTPAVMTAAGIVCRQYLQKNNNESMDPRSPAMTRGVDIIVKHPPNEKIHNYYYYYYATYALLPVGGDAWKSWNPRCRDLIVSWQDKGDKNPALMGSWDSQGAYQLTQAGRVGVTALALLTLEVYYRHLPVNRPELGEMAKAQAPK